MRVSATARHEHHLRDDEGARRHHPDPDIDGRQMISAIETAVMVGGLSALGAALYSIGIPKDSVIQYEAAVKADDFRVMAHGSAAEIARAKAILGTTNPSRLDVHAGAKAVEPAAQLAHAGG